MAPHVPPSTYAPWGAARAGTPADAIDGVTPQCVVDVDSGASLAAALAHAATNGHRTVVRGGGTKVEWGRAPASVDVIVSTAHLNRIVWHSHGDLVATIQAGTPLATVNAALGGEGQWLPLDSAHDGATVGGMVAANETGPMRHRWGAPRDLLIGVTLALTDGRVVKAGGRVVKNVAGYDIGRLMSGSFGSLAAIVDATFKLAPRPAVSRTLVATFQSPSALPLAATAVAASQLDPLALDVEAAADSARLFVRFASTATAVDAQLTRARALLSSASCDVTDASIDGAFWHGRRARPWAGRGAVVRLGWRPAGLSSVLSLIDALRADQLDDVELVGRAGLGTGLLRLDGSAEAQARAVTQLRATPGIFHVVVLRADVALKRLVDVWGSLGTAGLPLAAIAHAFDPAGILNAGRGPHATERPTT